MTPAPGTASPSSGFLSAHIALVGRPNSGKSSLLNAVMQEEVSIVTPLPQTTRANLRGIYTDKRMQLIFVDTPGMHRGKHAYNEAMTRESESVVHADEVDIVCYVVDLAREFGPEEDHVAEVVQKSGAPVMVVLNKVDVCADPKAACAAFFKRYPGLAASPRIEISAIAPRAGKKFLSALSPRIKPGPQFYPEEDLTDKNLRFFAAEFLRKHIIGSTREEVPHAAFVEITDYKEGPTSHKVEATIHVESMGQRGIIIGPKGSLITRIQREAERDLGRLAQTRVSIKCHVKVSERWRDNHGFLRSMGYEESTRRTPRREPSPRG